MTLGKVFASQPESKLLGTVNNRNKLMRLMGFSHNICSRGGIPFSLFALRRM